LIEWAIEREAWLVEDDYDSEFRYDREAARALQGLAPDKVVLVGTVSKTLAPALRLGWIAAPLDLVERLVVAKRLADDFTPALDQLALAELLSTGAYDRYVRKTRAAYRRRRDELLAALAEYLPELAVEGVAAGVHLMARLGPDADDETLAGAARAQGVHVEPLSRFYIDAPLARGLVLGYGRLHESAIRPAVRALAHAIAGQIGSQGRGHRGRAA
jgi:GntR family transcriptional regulator/MocR family aminotransferase